MYLTRLCFETKSTKLYSKMLLVKSSENNFVFLPVFYLIMWLIKASKNFGKMSVLKICELISLGGVKTHFGKLMMLLQAWLFYFCCYYDVALDPIKILTHKGPQNDGLNLSFVKHFNVVSKKWPKMVINDHIWVVNFQFFSYKIENGRK